MTTSGEEKAPMLNLQTERALTAILLWIEKGADELLIRRIWDDARRAALDGPEHD